MTKFPVLLQADDYHDFDSIRNVLNRVVSKRVKFVEVTPKGDAFYGVYFAVFYDGKKPTDEQIEKLIEKGAK